MTSPHIITIPAPRVSSGAPLRAVADRLESQQALTEDERGLVAALCQDAADALIGSSRAGAGREVTIPAPHVPTGPLGGRQGRVADAAYLREVVERLHRRLPVGGSGVRAMVAHLCRDSARALDGAAGGEADTGVTERSPRGDDLAAEAARIADEHWTTMHGGFHCVACGWSDVGDNEDLGRASRRHVAEVALTRRAEAVTHG